MKFGILYQIGNEGATVILESGDITLSGDYETGNRSFCFNKGELFPFLSSMGGEYDAVLIYFPQKNVRIQRGRFHENQHFLHKEGGQTHGSFPH